MKSRKILCVIGAIAIAAMVLVSCGQSKVSMEKSIKADFQEKMDSDPNYKDYGMQVQEVTLVKSGLNTYKGFVTVLLDDETHNISISVTADGSSFMWQTDPLAFGFLIQKALKDLDFSW